MNIRENIERVRERIETAAHRSGQKADDIILVAVTKEVDIPRIREALAYGVQHIGENRVQEAQRKFEALGRVATWHMVGHLQTNKVKKALEIFDLIHSLDRFELAQEISKRAQAAGRTVDVLVQVNTSGEPSKFGVAPEGAPRLVEQMAALPCLRIQGLMTIGAFLPDPEAVRPCFTLLRKLRDEIALRDIAGVSMKYLSMGMTNDFEVAIEEGANLVRIGRAIFGEREPNP